MIADDPEKFLEEMGVAFDSPGKKAVFMEGALAGLLLNVQYASRESKPFTKKLHGLKLDGRRVKKLFPEIIQKLREYGAGYPELETITSEYLLKAEEAGWNLSKDEISWFFTLGLELCKIFKKSKGGE